MRKRSEVRNIEESKGVEASAEEIPHVAIDGEDVDVEAIFDKHLRAKDPVPEVPVPEVPERGGDLPMRGMPVHGVTPIEFLNANAAREVPFDAGFEGILETVFVKDTRARYDELMAYLKGKESRSTRDLDDVEYMARKAHDLWMTAKRERERWETRNKIHHAALYERAYEQLQQEKKNKERSKVISNEDVETRWALLYPDEYEAQRNKQRDVKLVEESMGNLYAMFEAKCRNMSVVVSKQR